MAKKSRWSRYRPPAEPRTEAGDPANPKPKPAPKATPKPTPKPTPRPKPAPKPASKAGTPTGNPWVKPLVVIGIVVAVVVGIAMLASGGDDDYRSSGVELELLDEGFVSDGLAAARSEEGDRQPVAVHLDEYGMTVEYFDPVKDESRYVETTGYSDDVNVRVKRNFYTGYDRPTPFDLAVVDPAAVVAAVKRVLEDADDPYSWEVRISVPAEGSEPEMVARASAAEDVERTSAP